MTMTMPGAARPRPGRRGRWWPTSPTTWPSRWWSGYSRRLPRCPPSWSWSEREVGERLAAHAGEEAYGAVSVKVAYWASASLVGRVPASVFIPRPKVESVLVRLDRRPPPEGAAGSVPYDRLFSVVRAGFAHRRKMLRRSLDGLVDPGAYAAANVEPTARAEELGLDEWGRLSAWEPTEPIAS